MAVASWRRNAYTVNTWLTGSPRTIIMISSSPGSDMTWATPDHVTPWTSMDRISIRLSRPCLLRFIVFRVLVLATYTNPIGDCPIRKVSITAIDLVSIMSIASEYCNATYMQVLSGLGQMPCGPAPWLYIRLTSVGGPLAERR